MVKKLIPHICIILSVMLLTFFVVDKFNPGMNFIGNNFFKTLLVLNGIAAIVTAGFLIAANKKEQSP